MKSIRIKYTAISKTGNGKFIQRCRIIGQSMAKHADVFDAPPVSMQTFGEAVEDLFKSR